MLETLRRAAGTWLAKLLLMLLVVSFAVWGVSGQIAGGLGSQTVVQAGGTEVSVLDYRLAYDRQISILSQRFGQRISREQAQALGLDAQVLSELVAGAVLDEQARLMGLGVSKDRLAELTTQDPAFQGANGQFDRQLFNYVLQQIGMRAEDYLLNREQVAVRQQIVEAVSDGMKMPDTFLKAVALYRGEGRTIEYLTLAKSLVEPIEEPSQDVLGTWFEANKASYAAPEYRSFSYVKLAPEDIMDLAAITDQQVRDDYEANKSRFTTPETRAIEQLLFPTEDAARAARASLNGGATFEALVEAAGKTMTDVSLGTLSRAQVQDPKIADAAFALAANQVSDVVDATFGPALIRVTAITPEVVRPYEEVAEEIRRDLALSEANRILLDVHDSYEDARAGGDSMQEAADKLKLKVVTIDAVDRAGLRPDGSTLTGLPSSADLLAGVFETDIGVENPSISVGAAGYVFYELLSATPARDRPLDEVRARAVQDWKLEQGNSRLAAKAEELRKRVADGGSLDEIATELSLQKTVKLGLKRGVEDAEVGNDGVNAAFSVPLDGTGVFKALGSDGQVVFKVTEVFEPAGADASAVPADQSTALARGMSDDLLDQLVTRLQNEFAVTINESAINRALTF